MRNYFRNVILKVLKNGKRKITDTQGYQNEEFHNRPMLEQFGFASIPPIGSKGIIFCPDGFSERGLTAFLDFIDAKPNLENGDSCIFDNHGNVIHLKNNEIHIQAAVDLKINVTGNCTVSAQQTQINSDVTVNGNLLVNGDLSMTGTANLGGSGGQPIARIGDTVSNGIITSGSGKASAV